MSFASGVLIFALFAAAPLFAAESKPVPPRIMLWSWDAPDDFRFLTNADIGVAYLALSIRLAGKDEAIAQPRTIPVRIGPHTWHTAVVRLDFDSYGNQRPEFSDQQRKLAVRMITEIAEISHAQGIQIDFDAPRSAYPFYRRLLSEVRAALGPKTFLSITALVSWCDVTESWMAGLPVDEIVPMAFYMGQATPAITSMLQSGGQFRYPACRASIGVMRPGEYDDAVKARKSVRSYFFSTKPWSAESVRAAENAMLP